MNAKLNPKQRRWVKDFEVRYNTQIKHVCKDLGDRVVTLSWESHLPPIPVLGCADSGSGWKIIHLLEARLRPSGQLRKRPNYSYKACAPCCSLDPSLRHSSMQNLQMGLPFGELLVFPLPKFPIYYRDKSTSTPKKAKAARFIQLSLPLFGVAAQLHKINHAKGNPVLSEQELLSESVAHYDLERGEVIKLPNAIVEILKDKQASLNEWDSAIALYQVAGPQGVLSYLEGIDYFRQSKTPLLIPQNFTLLPVTVRT